MDAARIVEMFAKFGPVVPRRMFSGFGVFSDGTMFAPDRLYLTLGRFVHTAPATSDYTYEHVYYRSIEEKREDWLTTRDFIRCPTMHASAGLSVRP